MINFLERIPNITPIVFDPIMDMVFIYTFNFEVKCINVSVEEDSDGESREFNNVPSLYLEFKDSNEEESTNTTKLILNKLMCSITKVDEDGNSLFTGFIMLDEDDINQYHIYATINKLFEYMDSDMNDKEEEE